MGLGRGIRKQRRVEMETLEPRRLLAANPMITEFMAKNDGFLEDGDGNAPDWIEIQNLGDQGVDLQGYSLTDTSTELARWVFPSVQLDPGDYLVVFASGQEVNDYVDAGGNLHTNFGLSASGEYLALVSPDGTVLSEYGTSDREYPEQRSNVSYGVAQRAVLVDAQTEATYWQPLGGDVDGIWTGIGFDSLGNGFSTGQAAMGYENDPDARTNFTGEILTELPPQSHAVYARMKFDVDQASEVSALTLQMKNDNGFVAYLNGTKVAESNAPTNPGWFSTATGRARDSLSLQFVDFDLTNHLSQLVDGTNVLAIHGLNDIPADRDDMLLVPQLIAAINSPNSQVGYMTSPTPGNLNEGGTSVFSGALGTTVIHGEPGFYDAPFTVTISTDTQDAEIRYTTDGRPPTATTGNVYSGPIQIDSTTTLRAATFKDGHVPSNVATQSYLFLDEIIRQPQNQPGLPASWIWERRNYDADYEMDQRIVDDPAYRDEIIDGMKSIRTMSIVMDPDDLFGPDGMHNNTELHGLESERPVSLEILNPDGSLAHQVDAGFRIHGNFTRHLDVTKKLSFRLTFRGQYGATKLDYPLFADSTEDRFDNVILHAGKLFDDVQLLRHSWGRDTNRAMGNLETHSTYVHLYLNGLYWGLYNPFERPDGQFAEEYLGGLDSDYDAILNNSEAVDGDTRRYNEMMSMIRSRPDTEEEYQELLRHVDLDSMLDFLLINLYMAHGEHELRAIGSRVGDPNFKFFVWDIDEQGMRSVRAREDIDTYFPAGIYDQLRRHPEIRMRYADRAHKALFNGGALTPEEAAARWEARSQEIWSAAIAETARWGDMTRRRPYTREDMLREKTSQTEDFFPNRTQFLIDDLRRVGIYPDVDAPQWNQFGGPVPEDFQLTMTHPGSTGVLLYTLDGSDPRQYGGDVAVSAIIHDGSPIPISSDTVVKARVLANKEWSALTEGEFLVVGPDSPFNLRVSEINYHPHEANHFATGELDVANSQFEYVELTNTGSQTINISGVELSRGATFTFPENTTLAAGGYVLAVKNREAFESRYGNGLNIAGEFESGTLPDAQGFIDLRDAAGRRMQAISYSVAEPWPQRANGSGSSLEIVNPFATANDPTNWRDSSQFGGSPGVAGSVPNHQIEITEVLANASRPAVDMLELHNASGAEVDIGNWYVSNSEDDYLRYQIPAGTTIAGGGYHVLSATELGFEFSATRGDRVWLVQSDASGKPSQFVDQIQFGPSGADISLGPGPDANQTWLPLAEPTFGRANSGLKVGDVIVSEIHYAPIDPDGDGRLLKADNFEYIELYNTTNSPRNISNWLLSGGAEFTFPDGTVIDAQQSLLVVPFEPTDLRKGPVFRVVNDVDPSVVFVGPYSDPLDDSGAAVLLQRPGQPSSDDPNFTPLLYVDEVIYQSTAPWPVETIGTGMSLTRLSADRFGNSPTSWASAPTSPGEVDFVFRLVGDANEDGRFDQLDLVKVLQGGKYQTGQTATRNEGDFNGDGVFDQLDLVEALQAGTYMG